ncbi:MAG: DUF5110 domain-containing protein, partial [Petrimonas sp.]|nr:DUF5110 domain-containing protein [Petrimonas sp.]
PVLKKGERVKRLYLPEGEWIDFNDKKTVYPGGQQITYRAPLNVIPLFVKKGSIIPMMPVMQYIHEKKDYPLFVHIFPNYEDETAEFELYEDDGENLDYLKDIASRTRFTCTTLSNGYRTEIEPSDKGFTQSDKRNIILAYHLEEMPASVTVNGKTAKKTDEASIARKAGTDVSSVEWSWNDQSKECRVKIPDQRKQTTILLVNK